MLCRQGVSRFGGTHSDYLSEAMKLAYARAKTITCSVTTEEHKPLAVITIITTLFLIFTLLLAPQAEAAALTVKDHSKIFFNNLVDSSKRLDIQYSHTNKIKGL